MFSFTIRILLATLLFTLAVHAEEPTYEPLKVWGAPLASAAVGFGVGHWIQDRTDRAKIFGIIDASAWGLVIMQVVACPPADIDHCGRIMSDDIFRGLRNVLIASRIVQAIDVSIYSVSYYKKFNLSAFVLPNEKGQQLTLAFEF